MLRKWFLGWLLASQWHWRILGVQRFKQSFPPKLAWGGELWGEQNYHVPLGARIPGRFLQALLSEHKPPWSLHKAFTLLGEALDTLKLSWNWWLVRISTTLVFSSSCLEIARFKHLCNSFLVVKRKFPTTWRAVWFLDSHALLSRFLGGLAAICNCIAGSDMFPWIIPIPKSNPQSVHRKYAATAFQGIQKEGDGEEESHFDAGEGLGISDFATDPDIYRYDIHSSLSHWQTLKSLKIPYLVGKFEFKLLFHGPTWLGMIKTTKQNKWSFPRTHCLWRFPLRGNCV